MAVDGAVLVVAGLASLFMAWTIGAGSSGSTPFAAAVGANAISIMRAGLVVGILGFLGAITQGANVSEAVGSELVIGVTLTPAAAVTGLLVAATLVAIGVFAGYPIATAFTVTGAVVGAGLAIGGDPNWPKYIEILVLWVGTPVAGGGAAYGVARLLRAETIPERVTVPLLGALVGAILANIEFAFFGPAGESGSVTTIATASMAVEGVVPVVTVTGIAGILGWLVVAREMRNPQRGQRRFLLAMGALVAFSAGGTQVGLAVGPLLPVLSTTAIPIAVPLSTVLLFGGIGLLLGSWTGAPRMIKALSQDYSALGPRRSTAALIPAFVIAQTAVLYGIPVSFNEIIVSTIVGAGYAGVGNGAESSVGGGGVSAEKMGKTVLAWIGSLVLAGLLGYAIVTAIPS